MRNYAGCSRTRLIAEASWQRAVARFHLARCAVAGILVFALLGGAVAQEPRTIPCLIAKLHVADFVIDDHEIIIAINLWIAQERVSPEIPRPISDAIMIKIIDLWVRGADCRGG